VESWNPIVGESFGQEERLTVRLRGLIRAYPRSVGIVKEFLQNADDAGATTLRVVWDEREHPRGSLPDPRMGVLQGPALLFINDQVFGAADLDAIRRIGESSKSALGPKTGRFGLGFNTAYNVTDHPSFVSGSWAVAFDPHRRSCSSEGEGTGRRWELADLWQFAPDWLHAFSAGGLAVGAAEHPATIFRLPIRDAAQARSSEICDEPFEREHFEQMLRDLTEAGDELLLFARNILDLSVERIDADGVRHDLLRITTLGREAVIAARARGNAAVEGDISENIAAWRVAADELTQTTYRHTFEVASPRQTERRPWQIAAGLFVDGADELLGLNEAMVRLHEKAIPWAGAAIRLEVRDSDSDSLTIASQRGKLFCTFPLAEQVEALPLHFNACFDLDSSRRQISIDDSAYAEADQVRVAWNLALLRHALPQAAALAIAALVPEVASASIGRFYALWPDPVRTEEPWRTLFMAVVARLAELPLIRTRAGQALAWETLVAARLPPSLAGPDLQEALRDDGLRLPDPDLPGRMVRGADAAGVQTRRYRPAELREWLRCEAALGVPLADAPRACLRERANIVDLLQFCLSDRKDDIAGLPLALTCDEKVRTFACAGELFLADDTTRRIFADHAAWFIEPAVQQHTRLQPCEAAQLREMGAAHVVARLSERLSLAPGETLAWDPDDAAPPNATWLALVLRYLAERVPATSTAALATLALFPDPQGRLHCAAGGLLLIPGEDLERGLQDALATVGVHLVAGGYEVVDAVRSFHARHPGPVTALTGPSLATRLLGVRETLARLPGPASERAALLDYLAAPRWQDRYGAAELAALRELPLLRTLEGRVVCAASPGVHLPGGFCPPTLVEVEVELVDAGPGGRWRPFSRAARGPRDGPGALPRRGIDPRVRRPRGGAAAGGAAVAAR
jgi:sacsin